MSYSAYRSGEQQPRMDMFQSSYSGSSANSGNQSSYFRGTTSNQGQYNQSQYNQSQYAQNNKPRQSPQIVDTCVHNHDPVYGQNYPWLEVLGHGRLVNTWFKEPPTKKEFTPYDSHWWNEHCKAILHNENLYEAHVATFTGPNRSIAMFFKFEDGSLIEAEPHHYALEHEYFNGELPPGYSYRP